MSDMREVTVMVPESHLAEFYARHAEWLDSMNGQGKVTDRGERQPWSAEDDKAAVFVWQHSPERSREILGAVLERGEIRARELIKRFGLRDSAELGGHLAWPGRLASQVRRKAPVRSGFTPTGTLYSMEPLVRELFRRAKQTAQ